MKPEKHFVFAKGAMKFTRRAQWILTAAMVIGFVGFAYFFYVCQRDGGDAVNGHIADGRYYLFNHHGGTEVSREVWERNHRVAVVTSVPFVLVPVVFLGLWLAGEIRIDRSKGTRETVPDTPTSVTGPVCFTGTVRVPGAFQGLEKTIAAVEAALLAEKPKSLARNGDVINFRAGVMRRVGSWNRLIAFDSGEVRFSIEHGGVAMRYKVSVFWMFLFTTLASLGLGVFTYFGKGPFTMAIVAWLWLFGMNALFGLLRFRELLRKAAATVVSN